MQDFKSILMTDGIQQSIPKIKENLMENINAPIGSLISQEEQRTWGMQQKLDAMKMEISEEIGLTEKLKAVGNDNGLLTPQDFGHLGGQMSKRLTERGKELYRRLSNE